MLCSYVFVFVCVFESATSRRVPPGVENRRTLSLGRLRTIALCLRARVCVCVCVCECVLHVYMYACV